MICIIIPQFLLQGSFFPQALAGSFITSSASLRLREKVCHNPQCRFAHRHQTWSRKREGKKKVSGAAGLIFDHQESMQTFRGRYGLTVNPSMSSVPSGCLRTGHYLPPSTSLSPKSWPVAAVAPVTEFFFCNMEIMSTCLWVIGSWHSPRRNTNISAISNQVKLDCILCTMSTHKGVSTTATVQRA